MHSITINKTLEKLKILTRKSGKAGDIIVNMVKTVIGAIFFYLLPRKNIVLIASSRRSGSTLLKALLAEAQDTSNLPELNYNGYAEYNKYRFYFDVFLLSKKRIIVLKDPACYNDKNYPYIPFDNVKVIVLIRNIIDTVRSLKRRRLAWLAAVGDEKNKHKKNRNVDNKHFVDYWCWVYESILNNKNLMNQERLVLKYEDLVEKPKKITKELFSFIGSCQSQGVDAYKKPKQYEWKWGADDGGELIKTLKVKKSNYKRTDDDKELLEFVNNSKRCFWLREKFGYNDKWR